MSVTLEMAKWRHDLLMYHAAALKIRVLDDTNPVDVGIAREAQMKEEEAKLWVSVAELETDFKNVKEQYHDDPNNPEIKAKYENILSELQSIRGYWRGIWQFLHNQPDNTGYVKVLSDFDEGGAA